MSKSLIKRKTTARFEPWLINNYYDGIVITISGTISVIT